MGRDRGLRAYTRMLRLFPRDFRDRHEREMTQMFLHLRARRDREGSPSRPAFWLKLSRDTMSHALHARWSGTQPRRPEDRPPRRTPMSDVLADLRFSIRTLVRDPLFTAVAVVTLALGMGANTAIFSVVHGVLLKPLPYPEPDRIVWVDEYQDSRARSLPVAWPNFRDWRDEATSFAGLAAFGSSAVTVLGGDRPLRARVGRVTRDFWTVFPVRPVAGRLTVAGDHVEDGPGAVVLREDLWRNEFGGRDLDQIVLEISGRRLQAVGVVPATLDFPFGAQLWTPAFPSSTSRTAHNWRVVGRLAAGVTLEVADQELDAITRRVVADEPADPDFLAESAMILPLKEELAGSARIPLLLLLGAAGLVLLVACTNLASTLLARGEARSREMAIRSSMGASRGRLVRQLVTESLVLSAIGGAMAILLAAAMLRLLRDIASVSVPRLDEIGVDPAVLLFTVLVVVVTALVFGLLPAARLSAVDVTPSLKTGARGGSTGTSRRVWTVLVGSEVALAFVLLAGSGLLIRSFASLLSVDRGFRSEGVVTAAVDLSLVAYPEPRDHARFYDEFLAELEAQPEIERAGVVSILPLSGGVPTGRLDLDGDLSKHTVAGYVIADAGFFDAVAIPRIRGRLFDERDGPDGAHVAVVSESFAEQAWPGEDPIGKQVSGGGMDEFWQERPFATVVGVVGDVRFRSLASEPEAVAYFPYRQRPGRLRYESNVVAHGAGADVGAVTAALRRTLSAEDPDVPPRFATMTARVQSSLDERRFSLYVLGGFAVVALILASVGIYGVVSYSVARRTREIGIRLALGAEPSLVRRAVQSRAMGMVAVGIVVGGVGALVATRLLDSLLFGVAATDPLTLAAVALVLAVTAWLATVVPALRSTRVDPLDAMRAE